MDFFAPQIASTQEKGHLPAMSKALDRNKPIDEFRLIAKDELFWSFKGAGPSAPTRLGVYQALHEAGVEPDLDHWTSSSRLFDAGIIAGNKSLDRWLKRKSPGRK